MLRNKNRKCGKFCQYMEIWQYTTNDNRLHKNIPSNKVRTWHLYKIKVAIIHIKFFHPFQLLSKALKTFTISLHDARVFGCVLVNVNCHREMSSRPDRHNKMYTYYETDEIHIEQMQKSNIERINKTLQCMWTWGENGVRCYVNNSR